MPKIPRNIKDASLKNLEVLDNDTTVYSDPSRKGFLVEINSQGRIIFSYEYKFNKNIRQIPLGTHPSVSLEKARNKWLESSKKVLDGKDIWLYDNVEALEEKKPQEAEGLTRILSESEILLFWKKIDSINRLSAITKLALKLILLTGIKKEDLLLATWADINIKKRSWDLGSKEEIFLNSLSFSSFSTTFFFILQLSYIDFSINGEFKFIISKKFLSKYLKNFLFDIKECLKISPYPQINSLLGNFFKKLISLITNRG